MPALRLVWLAGVPWSLRGLDWREVDGSARCVFRPLGPTGLWAHGRYTCSVLGSWCLARFLLFLLVFFFYVWVTVLNVITRFRRLLGVSRCPFGEDEMVCKKVSEEPLVCQEIRGLNRQNFT